MPAIFGPSGNSQSFYDAGGKSSVEMPAYLAKMGLKAYEYQCSKGVRINEKLATQLGAEARKHGIALSIHAPYYISMASVEQEKRDNSVRYVLESMMAARWMGATRVVVHTGAVGKETRQQALERAMPVMKAALDAADSLGLGDIHICPEVLGKQNQLGDLSEVLTLCGIDERMLPTIDFGHIHARDMGILNTRADFEKVLNTIENAIGNERLRKMHVHFSRIEYTKGGEKKHWQYKDTQFGPDFDPLAELLAERDLSPVIICESRENMAEDAAVLMGIYQREMDRLNKGE